jgi:tetratricopeptide (TPR) repeat protein
MIIIILCVIILFSESVHTLHAQSQADKFKRSAISKMNEGQYGEAIDLLNKYISANPQSPDGYYLRGICLEARGQYEFSVYDLRSASKLTRNDIKISNALSRVTEVWYTQLYNKIEGHRREIVIYPKRAINFLEIGKCYKNLGNWNEAEEWYDKYLLLEEPSADEVIRYTEILAKTGHLTKGEIILKKFVEKYPEDHRLWSRYGYFTLWLGKNKISIMAFKEALKFRPFFKEAIDGLNLAEGKGSVYTVNDTSYRYDKFTGTFRGKKCQEYPIDKYIRILRKQTSNDSIRILLINDLVKVNRLEEAKQQLLLLNRKKVGDAFNRLENEISEQFQQYVISTIEKLKIKINQNPNDRKSVIELGSHYTLMNNIRDAELIYEDYLKFNPDDEEIRYELAKRLSWYKEFEKAKIHADILLTNSPEKSEYQLLRGQIAVWTNTSPDLAFSLLQSVLKKDPQNIQALLSLAILNYQTQKFAASQNVISQIERIDPSNPDVSEIKYNLFIQQKQFEENESLKTLETARRLLNEKKCNDAVILFKEYLLISPDDVQINLELANAYVCANDYSQAIKIYSSILDKGFDYDLAKQRAKWYFWKGDSVNALKEFQSLNAMKNDDAEVNLFLADSYFKMKDYFNSKKLYMELQRESPSSMLIKNRLGWLPEAELDGSFSSFISNFPTYILLTPELTYFNDNLSFKYNLQGMRAELGFTKHIAIGGSLYRGDVSSDSTKQNFYAVAGHLTVIPTKFVTLGLSLGETKYRNSIEQKLTEVTLKSEKKDSYSLFGSYRSSDAVQLLYSPFLVGSDLRVIDYKIGGTYYTPSQMVLSGEYSYKKISDNNQGRVLTLRLGRKFSTDFTAGYEYYNLQFDFENVLYYSPGRFESHSLWADYKLLYESEFDLSIGGKIGLVPNNDFLIKELNSVLSVKLFDSFTMQGRVVLSENSRDIVNYRSTSVSILAFWIL